MRLLPTAISCCVICLQISADVGRKISPWDQKCYPVSDMPKTDVTITQADATAFWLRSIPDHLAIFPAVTNDWESGGIYPDSIRNEEVPKDMTKAQYAASLRELHEFKRDHADSFWEAYKGQRITVEGCHYCPCCFHAAIRTAGCKGWTNAVIRLGYYISIGLPPDTRCYTDDGSPVPWKTSHSWPPPPTVKAVGTVRGPYAIPEELRRDPERPTASAYYILEQGK